MRLIGLGLLLVLGVAAVYWPAVRFDFVNYDDPVFVVENSRVHGLSLDNVRWAFTSVYIYWQPLTWMSYMLDWELHGLSAGGYHLTNLLLHTGSTLLLFLALQRMTRASLASAIVAALFALHPLHVETAVWVAERKGALAGVFWAGALLAYAWHAERPSARRLTLVTACFALGLMAKSIVIPLPCVLLLLDHWPLDRIASSGRTPATPGALPRRTPVRLVVEKVPLFVLAALSGVLTVVAQQGMGAVFSTEVWPLPARIAQAVVGYATYVRKAFWPDDLTVFYPNPGQWPIWQVIFCAVFLGGVTVAAWRERRGKPYLLVGWLWFLGVLLPVSGLVQTGEQVMADRYVYLASTGLFLAVVWGAAEALSVNLPRSADFSPQERRSSGGRPCGLKPALRTSSGSPGPGARLESLRSIRWRPSILAAGAVLALVACGVLTWRQVQTWSSTRALFLHANAVTRNNYLADTVLGRLLVDEGKYDAAIAHLQSALRVQPYYAVTHHTMGDAYVGKGDFGPAIEHYTLALKADPKNLHLRQLRIAACIAAGRWEEAATDNEWVLKAAPDSSAGEFAQATIRQGQRRYADAVAHYRRSLTLDPDQPATLNNLAWILATHPDARLRNGAEAVRLARRGVELTKGEVPVALGTLAAALAETGDFAGAIEAGERARVKALDAGQADLAKRNAELLELYRANQPCRDPAP